MTCNFDFDFLKLDIMEKKVKEFRQLSNEQLGEVTGGKLEREKGGIIICKAQISREGECTKFDKDCNCLQWGNA